MATEKRQNLRWRVISRGLLWATLVVGATLGAAGLAASAAVWSVQHVPAPRKAGDRVLSDVSCVSSRMCVAVGGADDTLGPLLAERWNGLRWSIQRTPAPAGSLQSVLAGVSCTSPSRCVAVGDAVNGLGMLQALAERWNGARWSIQRARVPTSTQSLLMDVSCTSAAACVAIGSAEDRKHVWSPVVDRWNGVAWTVQRSPSVPDGILAGLSCAGPACVAVGSRDEDTLPLVERWSGHGWEVVKAPIPDVDESDLDGVSCVSARACVAVGTAEIPGIASPALIEHWNGRRWMLGSRPRQLPGPLLGVSCVSARLCTAVGSDALVERLHAGRWTVQAAPDPDHASLLGVSCAGQTACIAVGSSIDQAGAEVPLAESDLTRP